MNTCKTCCYYSGSDVDSGKDLNGELQTNCMNGKVSCGASDDSDSLSVWTDGPYPLVVGPDFGCIHHKEKQ